MITNRAGTIFDENDNPFALNQFQELLGNISTIRTDLVRAALHARKDINKECDYPNTESITLNDYKEMYDRSPIGKRVVSVLPEESWQIFPEVFEDEDVSITTEFEKVFSELSDFLGERQSWFSGSGEVGNPLWEYLHRVDRLSGIGHFGVILIGVDDGKRLHEPIDGFVDPVSDTSLDVTPVFINNQRQSRRLIYLSVFSEFSVTSIEFEQNVHSPRYRLPKFYNIDLGATNTDYVVSGRDDRSIRVHWSRIIHIADNMDASEVIGVPRMRPVWNNLLDLMKIYGGDAEGFWKGCINQIFLESHPQLGGDVDLDEDALQDRMWDMQNGLQRWAALTGMSAKTVAPTVVDPTTHINVQLEAICIKIGMPKRIFTGSERGELASSQDDSTWNDRLRGRRNNYLTPRVIVPFIDRLIQIGVLPEPKEYKVKWPDPETLKPQEKAQIALQRVDTMTKYIQGDVESLMDPLDFLVREMEIPEDEAVGILERALELAEAEQEAAAEQEPPPITEEETEELQEPELEQQEEEVEIEEELEQQLNEILINQGGFKTEASRKAFFAKLGKVRAVKSAGAGGGPQRGLGGKFQAGAKAETAAIGQRGGAEAKAAPKPEPKAKPAEKEEPKQEAKAAPTEPKAKPEEPAQEKVVFEDRKKVRKFKEKDHQERIDEMNKSTEKLNSGQREQIEAYTSGEIDYQTLNKKLREGKKLNKQEQADLDGVNDAVNAAGNLPPGTKVYRGITLNDADKAALIANAKKGSTMEMPGLTSTSIDPSVSGVFGQSKGGIVFEMAPKSGAYVSSLSGFDRSARRAGGLPENEVLLGSGKKFRVVEVLEDVSFGKKVRKGFGQTVIQLEEI